MTAGFELWAAGDRRFVAGGEVSVAKRRVRDSVGPSREERRTFLDFLDAHDDALHRTCAPGHLTGSGCVVDPARGQVLLLFHTKLRRWLQPGGHADGEADLAAVALREATEETGIEGLRVAVPAIDLDVHEVRPPGEPAHRHFDVRFLVVATQDARVATNHESQGARWIAEADLDSLDVDAGLRRLASRATALAPQLTSPGDRTSPARGPRELRNWRWS